MNVNGIGAGTTWPFSSALYARQSQSDHQTFMKNVMNQLSDEEKKATRLVQNSLNSSQKLQFQQGLKNLEHQTKSGQVSNEEAATRFIDLLEQAASTRQRPQIMTASRIDLIA